MSCLFEKEGCWEWVLGEQGNCSVREIMGNLPVWVQSIYYKNELQQVYDVHILQYLMVVARVRSLFLIVIKRVQ